MSRKLNCYCDRCNTKIVDSQTISGDSISLDIDSNVDVTVNSKKYRLSMLKEKDSSGWGGLELCDNCKSTLKTRFTKFINNQ